MIHKAFACTFAADNLDAGIFSGHASIFHIPDDGQPPDIVMPGAFQKTIQEWGPSGKNRIKILAQHRADWLPIGKPLTLEEDAKGLKFTGRISPTTLGRDVLTLMRDGVISEMSIGFDVVKDDFDRQKGVRLLREVRLWEISPVTWAMHPDAKIEAVKAVPRNVSEQLADRSTPWTAPRLSDFIDQAWDDLSDTERRRIAGHFAWARTLPPETFGDLKLPHHDPQTGKVVWRGVVAAMAALLGARGGVDIPEADRRAVYAHLASHYEQFDETPPAFRQADPERSSLLVDPEVIQSIKGLTAEMQLVLRQRRTS